jgi:purine-cytosine permease-like protein
MPVIPKRKAGSLIGGTTCFILGIVGFLNGFNSPEQWRQSFGIVSFVFMTAIFIATIVGVYKNKN